MSTHPETPPPNANPRVAFGFILVTVVLDTLAFGVMAPVLPKLLGTGNSIGVGRV